MAVTEKTEGQTGENPEARAVDPTRLASGQWCHRAQKTIGQGDIYASYSADCIGMGQPVRKPFAWEGGLWVCVSMIYRGESISAEAYRLTHPAIYGGDSMTYAEKTADSDAARADPNGFYHGMSVRHGGAAFVLRGPPVTFIPGKTAQLSLF